PRDDVTWCGTSPGPFLTMSSGPCGGRRTPAAERSPNKADEATVVCLGCGQAMRPRAGLMVGSNHCAHWECGRLARLNPKGDELAPRPVGRPRPRAGDCERALGRSALTAKSLGDDVRAVMAYWPAIRTPLTRTARPPIGRGMGDSSGESSPRLARLLLLMANFGKEGGPSRS